MKIKKLVLQNFKKFSSKTIELGDTFNVVIGENESGKSTIVEALFLVLYANPASKSRDLVKYYSWENDKPFRLELELEVSGKKYNLVKDFLKKEGVLKLPNGKEIINPDLIQNYLYSELKIPLKSVYLNSAFIKQDAIMKLDYDGEFKNSIQNMVVEGEDEVDISNIIKGLDKKIGFLAKGIKGNAINPGPIKALSEKISKDEVLIKSTEDKWKLSLGSQELVEGNNSEISKLTEDINIKAGFFKKINNLKDLSKKVSEFNSKYDELEKISQDYQENESAIRNNEIKIQKDFKIFDDDEDLSKVEEDINTLLAQEDILSKVENIEQKVEPKKIKLNIALIVGVLSIGIVLSLIFKDILPILISSIISGIYVFVAKLLYGGQHTELESSQEENDLLEETKEKIESICKHFGFDDAQKILDDILEYQNLVSKVAELELKKKYILGRFSIEEIELNKKALLKEITKIEIQIDDNKIESNNYTEEKIHQLEYDIEKSKAKLQKLNNETMILEARLASSDISLESINIQKEQLEENKNELLDYQNELDILQLVKDSIQKSYEETVKDSGAVIEELINKNISHLTNGRYTKVKLSPELDLQVFSKEKMDYITFENLSKGTIDQIFMLVRLGFAESLLGGNKMPVILDDPFVNFDEKRLMNIKEILIKMSSEYQMILFSHNSNYSDWGSLSSLG